MPARERTRSDSSRRRSSSLSLNVQISARRPMRSRCSAGSSDSGTRETRSSRSVTAFSSSAKAVRRSQSRRRDSPTDATQSASAGRAVAIRRKRDASSESGRAIVNGVEERFANRTRWTERCATIPTPSGCSNGADFKYRIAARRVASLEYAKPLLPQELRDWRHRDSARNGMSRKMRCVGSKPHDCNGAAVAPPKFFGRS
jgi:hypothetical protein